jgi:hypothetical protein
MYTFISVFWQFAEMSKDIKRSSFAMEMLEILVSIKRVLNLYV